MHVTIGVDPRWMSVRIGDVSLCMLIDSGASVNTIMEKDWREIFKHPNNFRKLNNNAEERITGYAPDAPLKLLHSFETTITINNANRQAKAKIFVIQGASLNLLSYHTAMELGVLKIGLDACLSIATSKEFPKIPIQPVRIRVNEEVTPRQITRVNLPKAYEQRVEERLAEMRETGIIEAVHGWCTISSISPMVIVPKGTNDFRIVMDYREVNKRIVREPHPLPQMDRILAQIPAGEGLIMSVLDLSDAFFHVELHKDDRHLTAFMTSKGLMQFTRLPFGLSISPEAFQKTMDLVFSGIENVIVYMDDILVMASSTKGLEARMKQVQQRINENNLTVNQTKSKYNQLEVNFLGFTISKNGIRPAQKKIEEIQNYQNPTSFTQLRSFLGLLTFLQSFVSGFANKVHGLREKLKEIKFSWTEKDTKEFESIKKFIVENNLMKGYFEPDAKTILYTDASPKGLGAVLTQKDAEGKVKIITYASKTLTKAEMNYPQMHREALAIVWAMEKFTYYLLGRKFILKCDNQALKFMTDKNSSKLDSGKRVLTRVEGWILRLEPYDYEFEHVSGVDNIADPASRMTATDDDASSFEKDCKTQEICALTLQNILVHIELVASEVFGMTTENLKDETSRDEELSGLLNELKQIKQSAKESKEPSKRKCLSDNLKWYESLKGDLKQKGGVLLLNGKIVLPRTLKKEALEWAHRGHKKVPAMKKLIRESMWWKGFGEDVDVFYRSCKVCGLPEDETQVNALSDSEKTYGVLSNREIRSVSKQDQRLLKVRGWLNKNDEWPEDIKDFRPFRLELVVNEDVLMKVYHRGGERKSLFVLPSVLRNRTLQLAHTSHPGASTMKRLIRKSLWWPKMDTEIENYVRTCHECQLLTASNKPLKIAQTKLPNKPWDLVSMDFSTASAKEGWKALVIVDHYSRFLVARQMHKTDAEAVIKALKEVFRTYYLPKSIQADNGPPFQSGPVHDWLRKKGIVMRHTTELNPTENGMVERKMQGINKISAIARLEKKSWSQALEDYVSDYNSWPHAATGIAPADLMFGRPVRHRLPNIALEQPEEDDEGMRDTDQETKSRRNDLENKKRKAVDIAEFKVGDFVMIRQEKKDKCDVIYKDSKYEIIEIKQCGETRLQELSTGKIFRRNVKQLKLWKERETEPQMVQQKPDQPNDSDNISQQQKAESAPAQHDDSEDPLRRSTRQKKPNAKYENVIQLS